MLFVDGIFFSQDWFDFLEIPFHPTVFDITVNVIIFMLNF